MTIVHNIEQSNIGTLPCNADGEHRYGFRSDGTAEATHIGLAFNDELLVLSPEKAWWLIEALAGQLKNVGYKIGVLPA